MAKNDNLTDFLTDVADAIRAKKGTTGKINPQNFSKEIEAFEIGSGGGDNPIIVTSEEEMDALLTEGNIGKYVKYVDTTEYEKVYSPVKHFRAGSYIDDLYFNTAITPDFTELVDIAEYDDVWTEKGTTKSDGSIALTILNVYDGPIVYQETVTRKTARLDAFKYPAGTVLGDKTLTQDEYALKYIKYEDESVQAVIYESTTGWLESKVHVGYYCVGIAAPSVVEQWISMDGQWEKVKKIKPIKNGDEFTGLYFNYNMQPTADEMIDWFWHMSGDHAPAVFPEAMLCGAGIAYVEDANDTTLLYLGGPVYTFPFSLSGVFTGAHLVPPAKSSSSVSVIDTSGEVRTKYIYSNPADSPKVVLTRTRDAWPFTMSADQSVGWVSKQDYTLEYLKELYPNCKEPLHYKFWNGFFVNYDGFNIWANWNLFGRFMYATPFPKYQDGQTYRIVRDADNAIVARVSPTLSQTDSGLQANYLLKGISAYDANGVRYEGTATPDRFSQMIGGNFYSSIYPDDFGGTGNIRSYAFAGIAFQEENSDIPDFSIVFSIPWLISTVKEFAFLQASGLNLQLSEWKENDNDYYEVISFDANSLKSANVVRVSAHRPYELVEGALNSTTVGSIFVDSWDIISRSSGSWFIGNSNNLYINNTLVMSIKSTDTGLVNLNERILKHNQGISSISAPSTLVTIGTEAMAECTGLTSVDLSACAVTSIGQGAFSGCTALTSVVLNDSVTSIGANAFFGCSKLTAITIKENVTSIGSQALQIGTSGLLYKATITFLGTTPPTISSDTFIASNLKKIIVPVGCGEIYKAATNWSVFADYIEEATESTSALKTLLGL